MSQEGWPDTVRRRQARALRHCAPSAPPCSSSSLLKWHGVMWSQKDVWKLQEKRSLICTTCGGPRCSPVIHNEPRVPALCKWAVVDTGQWSPNELFGAGGVQGCPPSQGDISGTGNLGSCATLPGRGAGGSSGSVPCLRGSDCPLQALPASGISGVPMPGWDIVWEKCKRFPSAENCTEKH